MGKYTKLYSNYILKTKHQEIDKGTIFERDWATIGERNRLESGKKPFWDSNTFLVTDNSVISNQKKHTYGHWSGNFTYNDVKNITDDINIIKLNTFTDDVRDYVYYGSVLELIRVSFEHIISEFPGNIVVSNNNFIIDDGNPDNYTTLNNQYSIVNQFNIDIHSDDIIIKEYMNELRFLSYSWNYYNVVYIDNSGNEINRENIIGYNIINNIPEELQGYDSIYLDGKKFILYNGNLYKWNNKIGRYKNITYECVNENDGCKNNYINYKSEYICVNDIYLCYDKTTNDYCEIDPEIICVKDYDLLKTIEIEVENGATENKTSEQNKIIFYMYKLGNGFIYSCNTPNCIIQPKDYIIDEYFNSLDGFEKQLLIRTTNPLYTNSFITPVKNGNDTYRYVNRTYTWPSYGYCIDISTSSYTTFVNSFINMANIYDEIWTDNLWRCMTHEAIKNFDWSYTRHYSDENEANYIIGGKRNESILRLYGRVFDDLKRYIDGIKNSNRITYDNINNAPNAELSDKNELIGWDIHTSIWYPYFYNEIDSSEIPTDITNIKMYFVLPDKLTKESPDYISIGCENPYINTDNEYTTYERGIKYYKKTTLADNLSLSYNFLFDYFNYQGENISNSGKIDNWINISSNGYSYVKIDSPVGIIWDNNNTFDGVPFFPTFDNTLYPQYIRVRTNSNLYYKYYEKITEFDNSEYLHDYWYNTSTCSNINQQQVDIDFMKRLYLSSTKIFKSKGTKECIEMALGMFGLGINEDYTLSERYFSVEPKNYDKIFYYYSLYSNQSLIIDEDLTDFPEYVDESSPNYIKVNGNIYIKTYSDTLKDLMVKVSYNRGVEVDDGTLFYGLPINHLKVTGKHYLIPYMDNSGTYDSEYEYFQSKGGWGIRKNSDDENLTYMETMSYLNIVSDFEELLGLTNNQVYKGEIFYVYRIATYAKYIESVPEHISHYFLLRDEYNPQEANNWVNIPMEGSITYSNYVPISNSGATHQEYLRAKYLDEMVVTNKGNNPHVGYGHYDRGETYLEYLKKPFKYSLENLTFNDDSTFSYSTVAEQIRFKLSEPKYNDKIKVITDKFKYEMLSESPNLSDDYWNDLNTYSMYDDNNNLIPSPVTHTNIYNSSPEYIRQNNGNGYTYFKKYQIFDDVNSDTGKSEYYINDKVFIIKNKHTNSNIFKKYFMDIVANYILQVIPSTSIVVFEDFNLANTVLLKKFNITSQTNDDTYGSVSGSGEYVECDNFVLKAIPNSGYHFSHWSLCNSDSIISNNNPYRDVVYKDECFKAVFEKDCIITIDIPNNTTTTTTESIIPCDVIMDVIINDDENKTYVDFGVSYIVNDFIKITLTPEMYNKYEFLRWYGVDTDGQYHYDLVDVDGVLTVTPDQCGWTFYIETKVITFEINATAVLNGHEDEQNQCLNAEIIEGE